MKSRFLLLSTCAAALALASPSFAGSSNTAYTTQSGESETLTLDQSGGNNDTAGTGGAPVSQDDGGLGVGGNSLIITQGGSYNRFGVASPSGQSGTTNTAVVTQQGFNSEVDLRQIGVSNGVNSVGYNNLPGYYNNIYQDGTASSSTVNLYQNGVNNVFDIGQGGANNSTTISQTGNNEDYVWIRQAPELATFTNTGAWTPTTGSNNTIGVTQISVGDLTYAVVAQGGGDGNAVAIWQQGSRPGINVSQTGNGNSVTSWQYNYNNDLGVTNGIYGVDTPVNQVGDGNQITNLQVGNNGTVNGSQNGYNNQVNTTDSGDSDTLNFNQSGSWNYIQNNQSGSFNTANSTQAGYNNGLYNYQSGSNNTLGASQTGDCNYIYNNQYGVGEQASLTQVGAGNAINGTQGGSGDVALVAQNGAGNSATYQQYGTGNHTTIHQ